MRKFFTAFLLAFCFWQFGYSQGGPPAPPHNFQLETRMHGGIFLQHHFEMKRFNAHFPIFEISLQRATFGKKQWEAIYRYPMIGLTYLYTDLGQNEALGHAHAIYPFINFPLNTDIDNSLNFKLGLGLAYLTNNFHSTENYQNFAIGSHLNAAVSLYLDYRKKINRRSNLILSAGLTHFSNGSIKTPNFGLNMLTVSAGYSYFLHKPNPYLDRKLLPELYKFEFDGKKWFSIEGQLTAGIKDMSQETGKTHFVYNAAINVLKQVSLKSKVGFGFDLTQDGSDKDILHKKGLSYENEWDLMKPGANLAYEMLLDRTSFLFNVGVHLSGAERSEGDIYQKLALKHLFTDQLFGTIALTVHFGKADFIGFGLGYRFDFKYY
ncbi:MAG: acyloxyacyl hydrolase [Bacteroidetes bacterium]|jgi:hypothetical protein|nr:acyloxyacyl hydrolase [Bacteroidota bacterium]